ncbi:MAG: YHYH domain-containing protein [Parvularculales bacterium]
MKAIIFKIFVITGILILTAVFAYTHSGRTDKSGGHYNRRTGTYHYHTPKTRSTTSVPKPTLPEAPPRISQARITPKSDTPLSPGSEKYIPTQLEWLVLQLNAKSSFTGSLTGNVLYLKDVDGNTVRIVVFFRHRRPVPGDTVSTGDNLFIEVIEDSVQREAKLHGWQNWVKTRVEKRYWQ